MIQVFYCTNTREYTNIPSCRGKLVSDSSHLHSSLINITDKVELIATEFLQQSGDCLGYLEQHSKSCKSYLVGKYIYFRL